MSDPTWAQTRDALRSGDAIRSFLTDLTAAGVPLTPTMEAIALGIAHAELLAALEAGKAQVERTIADEQRRLARLADLYDDEVGS